MRRDLKQYWQPLASRYFPGHQADLAFDNLWQRYNEPHRHYHNVRHLLDLLQKFQWVRYQCQSPELVQWAIWYHDAIYRVGRKDNEAKSAELADTWLSKSSLAAEAIAIVKTLILATAAHGQAQQSAPDTALFLDLDLSILGSSPAEYQTYCQRIRREYRIIPGVIFRARRRSLLRNMLAAPRLFYTDWAYEQYEQQARANLKWEIQHLG